MDATKFKLELEERGYKLYVPINTTDYHESRHIEANKYNLYAAAGLTNEALHGAMDNIIEICNAPNFKTGRTDIAAIANAIKYCTRYPVDEKCAIRVGCVLTFIEYTAEDGQLVVEDPEKPNYFFQQKKERLAEDFPEFFSFFLQLGVVNSPNYVMWLEALNDSEYLSKRREEMKRFLPHNGLPGCNPE